MHGLWPSEIIKGKRPAMATPACDFRMADPPAPLSSATPATQQPPDGSMMIGPIECAWPASAN
jgi:hypothetical protein